MVHFQWILKEKKEINITVHDVYMIISSAVNTVSRLLSRDKALCNDVTTQNLPWLWLFSDLWEQSISFFICKSTQSTEHETTMSFMIINSAEIPC